MALATNAFTNLLRRLGSYIVPVYDYVLVTEPLSPEQQDAVGWEGRQGLADLGNQFLCRLTADNRILWGGYDVIYHFGNRIRAEQDQRLATRRTGRAVLHHVPSARGLRFTDGAVIDTAAGSPRSGAVPTRTVWPMPSVTPASASAPAGSGRVMLDLLDGADNERTRLTMVRTKPNPLPTRALPLRRDPADPMVDRSCRP